MADNNAPKSQNAKKASPFPPLRGETLIYEGGTDFNGTPTWVIHDPINNQFYQIGWVEHQILSRWHFASAEAIVNDINQNTTLTITTQHVNNLLQFLHRTCLLHSDSKQLHQMAQTREKQKGGNIFSRITRQYLFIRLPLCKPDHVLDIAIRYTRWLFHRYTVFGALVLAVLALYFLSRQWEQFIHTYANFTTGSGFVLFLVALIISKVCHELGHALICKKFGLHVPTMGVAFMVMWPIPYTDTAESWRLQNKYERMQVSLGGMWMEMYLAIIAAWLWLFLPDGVGRSIVFYLAAVNWIISILFNASPFMRFDGYHILSDLLGVRNLQTRGFQVTRWWIREKLFLLGLPIPEPLTPKQLWIFISYSISTWIYRLFLFLLIALLVYNLFYKPIGVLLLVLEIFYFIVLPIFREFKTWWQLRHRFSRNRNSVITTAIILMVLLLLIIPWRHTVNVPATLSHQHQRLFTPEAAQVVNVEVKRHQKVQKNQILITLTSPQLNFEIAQATLQLASAKWQLQQAHYHIDTVENHHILFNQLKRAQAKLAGLKRQKNRLSIRAPFSGTVADIAPSLHSGQWLKKSQMLLSIVNPNASIVEGFIDGGALEKINPKHQAVFYPNNLSLPKTTVNIRSIAPQPTHALLTGDLNAASSYLTGTFYVATPAYHATSVGGSIPVRPSHNKEWIPEYSVYRVEATPIHSSPTQQVEVGQLALDIAPYSIVMHGLKYVISVLIRESGI